MSRILRPRLTLLPLEDRSTPAAGPSLIGSGGGAFPPTANDDAANTDGTNPVTVAVLANDAGVSGRALAPGSVAVAAAPARGTVAIDPATGNITYTADGFFRGTDTFTYTVADNAGAVSNAARVTVVVNRPTANDDFAETTAGSPVAIDVLRNDADPDGNEMIVRGSVKVVTAPARGTAVVDATTGQVTFTPAAGFTGTASFTYTIADDAGAESAPGTVTVVVNRATPVTTAPTANDDAADTDGTNPVAVDVLANDTAAAGRTLRPGTVTLTAAPARGTVTIDPATGAATYTATGFFRGTDTFAYTVADDAGAVSGPATVTVVVNRPTANDDFADTDGNNPVTVDVTGNDTDPDGNEMIDHASVAVVTAPAHGTVTVDSTTGAATYTATGSYTGTDTFQYTVADEAGAVSAPGTVTVVVNRPTANPDAVAVFGPAATTINVAANDTDPDGNQMLADGKLTIVSAPAHGTAAAGATVGEVIYTPAAGFLGTDTFTYTITDGPGAESNVAAVRVRVGPAAGANFTAAGADAGGGPRVVILNADGSTRASFYAFDAAFTGGVRVAVGDVTGDGVPDLIATPGPGGGPVVRVFSGVDFAPVASFFAADPAGRFGATVAVGDVDGDGTSEVVVGTRSGTGAAATPAVGVFTTAGKQVSSFAPFAGATGIDVNVAAADVDGDGAADVVTGAGPGGGPRVEVFSGKTRGVLRDFFAYDPSFRGGVNVGAGDTTGDGLADVLTAPGVGGGPQVVIYDAATDRVAQTFFAYPATDRAGARVTTADVNRDGRADVIVAPGSGTGRPVKALDGVTLADLGDADAFTAFAGGVYVGGLS